MPKAYPEPEMPITRKIPPYLSFVMVWKR